MDPEDIKSLDGTEGGALAEERSENNSSNSDIVHVEREEAELLEADAGTEGEAPQVAEAEVLKPELQESVLGVLDSEGELAELSTEAPQPDPTPMNPETPEVIEAPETLEPTGSEDTEPAPPGNGAEEAGPDGTELPPAEVPDELGSLPPVQDLPPPLEPEPEPETEVEPEPQSLGGESQQDPDVVLEHAPVMEGEAPAQETLLAPPEETPVQMESPPKSELPMLLYGGAALVAIVAVIAYGTVVYRRK
ncbi:protein TsetseEP-like [Scleropages formosus]|nr:protein TsetseEP-like [Scleropages formosus]XP_018602779.1 protein TsetseEP-like [Scleropages formosus]